MKKQLQLLKSMELDINDPDPIGEKTVLKLLKEKSRRLETEAIQLRVCSTRPIVWACVAYCACVTPHRPEASSSKMGWPERGKIWRSPRTG